MSYRILERPLPPKPQRSMQTATTPGRFFITNGDTNRIFGVPCVYSIITPELRIQNRKMMTEYRREPSTHNPIIRKLHDSRVDRPIHFNKEYYKLVKVGEHKYEKEYYKWNVKVILEHDEDGNPVLPGLTMSGYIDEQQDWVLKFPTSALCPTAQCHPKSCKYSVVMYNTELDIEKVVMTGLITVLPAVIEE